MADLCRIARVLEGDAERRRTPSVTIPPRAKATDTVRPSGRGALISMHSGIPQSCASDTMPLIAARTRGSASATCRSPKYAPAAIPMASSSFAT
jgi:hypothetical protein